MLCGMQVKTGGTAEASRVVPDTRGPPCHEEKVAARASRVSRRLVLGPGGCGRFQRGGRVFGCSQLSAEFAHHLEGPRSRRGVAFDSSRRPDLPDCGGTVSCLIPRGLCQAAVQ